MKTLEDILKEHSFFKDLKPEYISFIAGCASNVRFKSEQIILRENEPADKFYLIKEGMAAIYIEKPRSHAITLQTIQKDDILGWSWLIPPHRYRFNARAIEDTRTIALDGKCLREKCEKNPDLGYTLLKKLLGVVTQRLEAARLQLLSGY